MVTYNVEALTDLRKEKDGSFRIRVRWEGYDSSDDTWEPLARLAEDVPNLVKSFLKDGVPEHARKLLPEVQRLKLRKLASPGGGNVG